MTTKKMPGSRIFFLLMAMTTILVASVAFARSHSRTHANASIGEFDYYLVSLSWSPSFCETHPAEKEQCGERGFGFVLHGVWPQYLRGYGPQHCAANQQPDDTTILHTLAFMPSRHLVQHEWDTHGACTGISPAEYFALADRAFASVKIPGAFAAAQNAAQLSAKDVAHAFIAANPGMDDSMLAVTCNRQELSEVRICMDKNLQLQTCGKGVTSQCPSGALRIPLVRGGTRTH
jgi:ribonuclease T2